MTIRNYQDLDVWKKAMDLAVQCYILTKKFPKEEGFGLVSQMKRAAISIPANIAEGKSRQYSKEFIQFLSIAQGSLCELETFFQIAGRLKYLDDRIVHTVLEMTAEIGRMLTGLKKSLRKRS